MNLAQKLMDLVAGSEGPLGFFVLGFCAFIEYVFPPFPGDLVVVFGAFLVARRGWSAPGVFGSVLAGSLLGFMFGYFVGRWLHAREERWHGRLARFRPQIDSIVERFRRHGALYLIINRFLPSVRALFFVAAGMARLSPWKVVTFGLISAIGWNALLFGLGSTAGQQWDRLERIFLTYGEIAWALVALIALIVVVRWWRRKASAR
jgi:membrane protein DedA with SNARE-associated domain